jgi:hypothetical protein
MLEYLRRNKGWFIRIIPAILKFDFRFTGINRFIPAFLKSLVSKSPKVLYGISITVQPIELFLSEYFQSPRRGILQVGAWRFIFESNAQGRNARA